MRQLTIEYNSGTDKEENGVLKDYIIHEGTKTVLLSKKMNDKLQV